MLPQGVQPEQIDAEKQKDFETPAIGGDLIGDLPNDIREIVTRWSELSPAAQERFRDLLKSL